MKDTTDANEKTPVSQQEYDQLGFTRLPADSYQTQQIIGMQGKRPRRQRYSIFSDYYNSAAAAYNQTDIGGILVLRVPKRLLAHNVVRVLVANKGLIKGVDFAVLKPLPEDIRQADMRGMNIILIQRLTEVLTNAPDDLDSALFETQSIRQLLEETPLAEGIDDKVVELVERPVRVVPKILRERNKQGQMEITAIPERKAYERLRTQDVVETPLALVENAEDDGPGLKIS